MSERIIIDDSQRKEREIQYITTLCLMSGMQNYYNISCPHTFTATLEQSLSLKERE